MNRMLVYGRNVARELLENNKKIQKIILQDGFNDKKLNEAYKNEKFAGRI